MERYDSPKISMNKTEIVDCDICRYNLVKAVCNSNIITYVQQILAAVGKNYVENASPSNDCTSRVAVSKDMLKAVLNFYQ